MRILDLDLDYFLDEVASISYEDKRQPSQEYKVWNASVVVDFLEEKCGFSKVSPIEGRIVDHHDEAFDFFFELIQNGNLIIPFEIVHIDAHSDLGFGDCGWLYLMTKYLSNLPKDRPQSGRDEINPCNYLAFIIGSRWVNKLIYVHHPTTKGDDILPYYFKNFNPNSNIIQLKQFHYNIYDNIHNNMNLDISKLPIIQLEPEIPIEIINGSIYSNDSKFHFIVISRSPDFTPKESDALIPIINEYIKLI